MNEKRYWSYALSLTETEKAIREELMAWLPDDIIDAHCHINLPAFINAMDAQTYKHMASTFTTLDLKKSEFMEELLFPGKSIRKLYFSLPFFGIDFKSINDYLLKNRAEKNRVAIFGLPDDIEYTVKMLHLKNVVALKMYHSSIRPLATSIYQFFRKEILEEAQSLKIPVILHLPTPVTKSITDLTQMLRDFPNLTVVLAHLGLPEYHCNNDFREIYTTLSGFRNLFMDTAMVTSSEVIYSALKYFNSNKIMFGSDEPVNMIRGIKYTHPVFGQRIVSDFDYHWLDPEERHDFGYIATDAPHFHWQSLLAIREAISKLEFKNETQLKEKIFYQTAYNIYNF